MGQQLEYLAKVALVAAALLSCLWTGSWSDCAEIYQNRHNYRPEVFTVTGACTVRFGKGSHSVLYGKVGETQEQLMPQGFAGPDEYELRKRYPEGTRINVLYNPEAGGLTRVMRYTANFWQEMERKLWTIRMGIFVPVPVTLLVYLYIERRNKRAAPAAANGKR